MHGLHTHETYLLPQQDLPCYVLPTTEGGISGIGRQPKLQPNSLVFGMFMDGKHSQTPIVLGSLPHIEFPTYSNKTNSRRYRDDSKPENVFEQKNTPRDIGIDDDNDRKVISKKITDQRTMQSVSF